MTDFSGSETISRRSWRPGSYSPFSEGEEIVVDGKPSIVQWMVHDEWDGMPAWHMPASTIDHSDSWDLYQIGPDQWIDDWGNPHSVNKGLDQKRSDESGTIVSEEALREFIRESFLGEGIMDKLFSRWRKGGKWLGSKGGGKLQGLQAQMQSIYNLVGDFKVDYPRASKRIRDNVRRIFLDIEHVNSMLSKGVGEKDFLNRELD
jgi:hypothetical protein